MEEMRMRRASDSFFVRGTHLGLLLIKGFIPVFFFFFFFFFFFSSRTRDATLI